jgi:hypothetical protein
MHSGTRERGGDRGRAAGVLNGKQENKGANYKDSEGFHPERKRLFFAF